MLNKFWFLSSHPKPAITAFQFTSQGSIAVVLSCIWTVPAWFSRAEQSPDSYPKKTSAILEFLSELALFHESWGGTDGRSAGMVPIHRSQVLPTHTTSSWDLGAGFNKFCKNKEQVWAVHTPSAGQKGRAEEWECLPTASSGHLFEHSFVSIRNITKTLSANSAWHITGPQKC